MVLSMELSTPENDTHLQAIRDRVSNAAMCLKLADAPNQRGVLNTVSIAIQNILTAAYSGEKLGEVAPEAAHETARLMNQAVPVVAEAMIGKMAPERVYFLMGAATGLLTAAEDPFRADRIDYAGMLAAELALVHHSRAITARGFPLLRAARMAKAWAEPRDPSQSLH
jgi:hypothetical protein